MIPSWALEYVVWTMLTFIVCSACCNDPLKPHWLLLYALHVAMASRGVVSMPVQWVKMTGVCPQGSAQCRSYMGPNLMLFKKQQQLPDWLTVQHGLVGNELVTDCHSVAMRKLLWHSAIVVFTKLSQQSLICQPLVNPALFKSFAPGFSSRDSVSYCVWSVVKRTLI